MTKTVPGFMPDIIDGTEDEDLSLDSKKNHLDTLKQLGIQPMEILSNSKKMEDHWNDSGNIYVRVRITNSKDTGT